MDIKLKEVKGLTLIELIIALLISGILIAALYRTFIGQQKTYTVQEQVVDMQQNVRISINKMMSEIRMAGFGTVDNVLSLTGGVNSFTQVITPSSSSSSAVTIVGGFRQIKRDTGEPIVVSSVDKDVSGKDTITLNYATDQFDGEKHGFISIGGIESNKVIARSERVLTLGLPLKISPKTGTPVFKIQAITYDLGLSDGKNVLRRNENTGGNPQSLAENIENVQFEYIDANGNPTADPLNIWMVRVTVTARTDMSDPEYKGGVGGFRRRIIASNIYIRNRGVYF